MASWDWDGHVQGWHHTKAAADAGVSPDTEPESASLISDEASQECSICKYSVKTSLWTTHTQSFSHQKAEKFHKYRAMMDEAEKDKKGLRVEGEVDLGYVEPEDAGKGVEMDLTIRSDEEVGKVVLFEAKLSSKQGTASAASGSVSCLYHRLPTNHEDSFEIVESTLMKSISHAEPLLLAIDFEQKYIGRYEDRLELVFADAKGRNKFIITRQLRAIVGSKADHEALKASTPYLPRKQTTRVAETSVTKGIPPSTAEAIPYTIRLPYAGIPKGLLKVLDGVSSPKNQLQKIKDGHFPTSLTPENHAHYFKTLLWIEEHRTE